MRTAQAVVDAQGPDFEVGEDAVDPGQDDMGGDLADDMRIVSDAGGPWVSRPSVGLGGRPRCEIAGNEGMQTLGRIVGHLGKTDAAGTVILDLDRPDDEDLALVTASAATGQRTMLAAAGNLGFIDLDQTGERIAVGRHHAVAQLGADQPGRLVRAESELALQLQRRDAVGMGRHQIGRPEPDGQRQLGVVHDGAGGHRGLPMAAGALPGPRLGVQLPGSAGAAAGAHKAIGPPRFEQVPDAGRLIREALLKLDQGARKCDHGSLDGACVRCLFLTPIRPHRHN